MAGHKLEKGDVVDFVKSATWKTAAHTFGNFHNTIIGLLVHAWINPKKRPVDRKERWVLEGAPALVNHKGHQCYSDGIFVSDTSPVGILEVEGLHPLGYESKGERHPGACDKMCDYLSANPGWFGLCVFYPVYPRGPKAKKELRFIKDRENKRAKADILDKGKRVQNKKDGVLMIVFIEKEWQGETPDPNIGLRAQGAGYGRGIVTEIRGHLIAGKTHREEYRLWP